MSTKHLVRDLITELGGQQRPAVLASIIGPEYVEHVDGSNATMRLDEPSGFPPGTNYQIVRSIAEGDLVLTHGLLTAPNGSNLVAIDVWKTDGDTVVGRWFSRAPEVLVTASGHSQLDGAYDLDGTVGAELSKRVVTAWMNAVLVGGDLSAVPKYISADSYEQHNPDVADGIDGFAAAVAKLGEAGLSFDYESIDIVVAEADFVFTRALGKLGPAVVFNDLWRVAGGMIVEHWDVVSPLTAGAASNTPAGAVVV